MKIEPLVHRAELAGVPLFPQQRRPEETVGQYGQVFQRETGRLKFSRPRPIWSRLIAISVERRSSAELLPPPALLAEPHLLGELGARDRVIGRHHGIVGRQTPLLAILVGRHIVLRAQVTLE
jgi:hypothetical protein